MRAVDNWDSARFLRGFSTLANSVFELYPRPAHLPLTPAVGQTKKRCLFDSAPFYIIHNLGDRHTLIQIHILDRVEDLYTFCHRALEGFASRDETLSTGAFVDHGSGCRFSEVVIAGGAAAVDESDATHVAVRHLIASEVDRVVTG